MACDFQGESMVILLGLKRLSRLFPLIFWFLFYYYLVLFSFLIWFFRMFECIVYLVQAMEMDD